MNKKLKFVTAIGLAALMGSAYAAVSESEASKLGNSLTPMGAEKSGNSSKSIPAWTGGLTKSVAGFVPGGHYPNPYADDKIEFSITAANADKYKDKLSPGQIALLNRYSDWKMNVYPSRRSAAYPEGLYRETKENATKVKLIPSGNGFEGTTGGAPFPIPQNGLEVMWNHMTAYKGDTLATSAAQAAVTAGGTYNLVKFKYEYDLVYSNQLKKPGEREDNQLFYFLQVVTAPPRLAGQILLVYDYADQIKQPRKAWTYNPGARRVRLAPDVAYDSPGTGADGLRTNDDFLMYNGSPDRYEWKLLGKKELYIPYNAYKINGNTVKISDVIRPGHVNPDLARYELHRVWVVEANLKPGTSHIYKKRVFYVDEDSWFVHVEDEFDNRDQLWRVIELHSLQYPDVPLLSPGVTVHHDLQSGRYLANGLRNEETEIYKRIVRTPADFTPAALRDKGVR